MEQATQATTPTASVDPRTLDNEHAAYQRAAQLLDRIVGKLTILPRQTAVIGDLDGFRLRLNYGTNDPNGVLEFATITDVEASRDHSAGGVWFEARATLEGIPVCAEVLLSDEAATTFGEQTPPPNPAATDEAPAAPVQDAAQPVPLGASILAHVQAVTPVVPAVNTEQLDTEDAARCVRCGCTEDNACEGGCYWVPNAQMLELCSACATTEELQAMRSTADVSDGGE